MLEATAGGGNTYDVTNDGYPVARLEFQGRVSESGAIVSGQGYLTIRRETATSGAWLLEQHYQGGGSQVIASAEKPSAMRNSFIMRLPGRELQLKRASAFRPVFNLTEAGHAVGTIRRARGFKRRIQADIYSGVPAHVQFFALWTTVLLERRAQKSRAAARAGR